MLPPTRSRKRRSGTAAVELALLLPALMFLWVISVDWARIFYYTITLEYAARDGVYWLSDYPGIYSYSSVTDAAGSETTNLNPQPTVTCSSTTSSDPNGATFSTYTPTSTEKYPANATFIKVQVDWTFNTVTNWPGVPSSTNITRSIIMKVAPIMPN